MGGHDISTKADFTNVQYKKRLFNMSYPTITVPFLLLFLVAAVGISGCSGTNKPADMPPLHPVTLTFKQEGEPLADAVVMLIDVDAGRENTGRWDGRWGPMGHTDASGTVEIFTNATWKGAPAGKYKIVLTKTEREPSQFAQPPTDSPDYERWAAQTAGEVRHTYSVIEQIYSSADTTPLEIEVQPKGRTQQTFEAGKKVRERVVPIDPRRL